MSRPTYRIETIADMLKVPADRRADMLTELEQALLMHEFSAAVAGLDWTDDGERSTHLSINGEPLMTLKVTKAADPA